ncbi:hypothetical protein PS880_05465 [Pseudomonas fluorescens]|uniref:Uncharacterized protein n=1 Tax=Pseudomonas fluorescens TaxID=294 RepID=A0A5E7PSQ7_PSEFL|nr:hypothetical protein PS880_05465 [Pseudomonas fluorescens]
MKERRKIESFVFNKNQRSQGSIVTDETISVLETLNKCRPPKVGLSSVERQSQVVVKWCLAVALVVLIVSAGFALFHEDKPASISTDVFVQVLAIVSMLLALCAWVVPMFTSLLLAFRWNELSLDSLCADIRYEQMLADRLAHYEPAALKSARFWLERKATRTGLGTARYFGERTAVIGLLATAYSLVGEFGGLDGFTWVSQTIFSVFPVDKLGDAILLSIGVLLLAMSIGTLMLEHLAARFKYQIEILDLVGGVEMVHRDIC